MSGLLRVAIPAAVVGMVLGCNDSSVKALNSLPTATITVPDDGAVVETGVQRLQGRVSDPNDRTESLRTIWRVDGTEVCTGTPEADGATECSAELVEGSVEVSLEAIDPQNASGVTAIALTVVVERSTGSVSIGPEPANTNAILEATTSGDVVGLQWVVDGVDTTETSSTLDGAIWFDKGQEVVAVAELGDGEQIRSNTVVVQNTPPGAPEVEVTFEEGCRSLQLDGINDWVELGSMGPVEDFTAEAWVRPGTTSLQGRVLDYDGGDEDTHFFLGTRTDGVVEVEVGRADPTEQLTLVSTTLLTDDRWHHVAAVRESGRLRLFVDGSLEAEDTGTSFPIDHAVPMTIGATFSEGATSPTAFFKGRVAAVRLSASARYSGSFSPQSNWVVDGDTVGQWMLHDGSGSTAADDAGVHPGFIADPRWVPDCPEGSDAGALRCVVRAEATDMDDDPMRYVMQWTVDGVPFVEGGHVDTGSDPWAGPSTTTWTDDTVLAGDVGDEQTWTCVVTPSDGESDGATAEASWTSDCMLGATPDCAAPSCRVILDAGDSTGSGTYWIDPMGDGSGLFEGYCDMSTDGGGWTLVSQGGTLSCRSGMSASTQMTDTDACAFLPHANVSRLADAASQVMLQVGGTSDQFGDWTGCAYGPCTSMSTDIRAIDALASPTGTWHNGATWSEWTWTVYCSPFTATGWPNMFHGCGIVGSVHWIGDAVPYWAQNNSGQSSLSRDAARTVNQISATWLR